MRVFGTVWRLEAEGGEGRGEPWALGGWGFDEEAM